jgi:hypothetical protein
MEPTKRVKKTQDQDTKRLKKVQDHAKMQKKIWYFVKDPQIREKYDCPACPFYYQKQKGEWKQWGEHCPKYHAEPENKLRKLLFKVAPSSNKHLISILSEQNRWDFYGLTEAEARDMIHFSSVRVWITEEEDREHFKGCYNRYKNLQRISQKVP